MSDESFYFAGQNANGRISPIEPMTSVTTVETLKKKLEIAMTVLNTIASGDYWEFGMSIDNTKLEAYTIALLALKDIGMLDRKDGEG